MVWFSAGFNRSLTAARSSGSRRRGTGRQRLLAPRAPSEGAEADGELLPPRPPAPVQPRLETGSAVLTGTQPAHTQELRQTGEEDFGVVSRPLPAPASAKPPSPGALRALGLPQQEAGHGQDPSRARELLMHDPGRTVGKARFTNFTKPGFLR